MLGRSSEHCTRVARQKLVYSRSDLHLPAELQHAVRFPAPEVVARHLADNPDWRWADHLFIAACRVPGYEGHGGQIPETDKHQDERMAIVEMFVQNGTPPSITNKRKVTPLHMACRFDLPRVAERLIKLGATVDAYDASRETPLYRAVNLGYVDCARVLLAAAANLYFQNRHGETALHRAARRGKKFIVPLLLDTGADPRVADRTGQTPLDCARNPDIKRALTATLA